MQTLFLDIETIGTDRQDVREYIAASIKPPATMSKAETIAKWMAESKAEAVEEAIAKTGLDGAFGRVCVIGWALDDGPVRIAKSANDEEALLADFAERLRHDVKSTDLFQTTVCGHNVSSFDLRFLTQRYIVNGIIPPPTISRAAAAKPWESEKIFDTMVQWAGVKDRVSLEKLCMALSITSPKSDLDGSKVAAAVAAGRIDDVAAYCALDVDATRKVWRRMTFQPAAIASHALADMEIA